MKIVFTGGGSGGHFYPIIAIVESIQKITKEKKLVGLDMYFFGPSPYNEGILYDHDIKYKKVIAGKVRRYFSILNFSDVFKTMWGVVKAFVDLFNIFPDVVFSKGGFGSFPTVIASYLLSIPVVIHESDSVPGMVNKWAGKFATRVAVSYEETSSYFKKEKVAYTGQPVLEEKIGTITENAHEFFGMSTNVPTIFVLGGSQGSEVINNAILDALPELVRDFQIIHQTGTENLQTIKESAAAILIDNPHKSRYKPLGYLNSLEMRMAAGASSIVVSRAGSTIFEIASWGLPSIIIPITNSNGNHQIKNAFAYAKAGACSVIKEENLKTHIFISEIKRIVENPEINKNMRENSASFFKKGASDDIAHELLSIVLSHQKLD